MNQQEHNDLAMWVVIHGNSQRNTEWDCITEQIACEMIVTKKSPTWSLIKKHEKLEKLQNA